MGGMTHQTAGGYGSSNKSKIIASEAQSQNELVDNLEWWMIKRNEILGSMIEDDNFLEYISEYSEDGNTAIQIDKAYLFEALGNIEAIRDVLDIEVMQKIFGSDGSDAE